MFTGLVEQSGRLVARTPRGSSSRLGVACALGTLELGESIAVEGVCLTVDAITPSGFECDATGETLARTTLGAVPIGGAVNLERALAVGERLGGHIVSGHVDGVGRVVERIEMGAGAVKVIFRAPRELLRFIAEKGSITVNGVSLTVNGVGGEAFDVMLIPHTLKKTTLADLRPGATVNLEVDVLARYVARLIEVGMPEDANAAWMARLGRAGIV